MSNIDGHTLVPLGLLVAALLGAVGATWRAGSIFSSIERRLERIEHALHVTWTLSHQQEWERQLKDHNPTIVIPSALQIHRAIRQSRESSDNE